MITFSGMACKRPRGEEAGSRMEIKKKYVKA